MQRKKKWHCRKVAYLRSILNAAKAVRFRRLKRIICAASAAALAATAICVKNLARKRLFPGKYRKTDRSRMFRTTAGVSAVAYALAFALAASGRCIPTMHPCLVTKRVKRRLARRRFFLVQNRVLNKSRGSDRRARRRRMRHDQCNRSKGSSGRDQRSRNKQENRKIRGFERGGINKIISCLSHGSRFVINVSLIYYPTVKSTKSNKPFPHSNPP